MAENIVGTIVRVVNVDVGDTKGIELDIKEKEGFLPTKPFYKITA